MPPQLEGVRVLSLAHQYPGPYATLLLADLGAEIIVVEHADGGDPTRAHPGFHASLNRSKASVALDLKDDGARSAFLKLARTADVVLEGYRPGTAERLGVAYDSLRQINEDLVYVSISGYGQDGPYRDRPGHDLTYQAEAGMLYASEPADGLVRAPEIALGDLSAGLFAVQAVLMGLLQKASGKGGGYYDVSMFDGLVSLLTAHIVPVSTGTGDAGFPTEPAYGLFPASDGTLIALGVAHEDHFWQRLCDVLELGQERELPRESRLAERERLTRLLTKAIGERDAGAWESLLAAAEVPFGRVRSLTEMPRHSHVMARGLIGATTGGGMGIRNPLARTGKEWTAAPALGDNTVNVLSGAGVADTEIADLLKRRVAVQAPAKRQESEER